MVNMISYPGQIVPQGFPVVTHHIPALIPLPEPEEASAEVLDDEVNPEKMQP